MIKYLPLGDTAFLIKLGNDISPETHHKVQNLKQVIERKRIQGVIDLTPAYNEIMISYNPDIFTYKELLETLEDIKQNEISKVNESQKVLHIPVCYDKEFAIDIDIVASTNGISVKDVVRFHTSKEYLVYMLGFTPGFCYLGGMDDRIATPRKEVPRTLIETGSVGIAGKQTGIYPIESPGGWQIIGKTPLNLFKPESEPHFLIEPGNYLKFYAISKPEFETIKREVDQNKFFVKTEIRDE